MCVCGFGLKVSVSAKSYKRVSYSWLKHKNLLSTTLHMKCYDTSTVLENKRKMDTHNNAMFTPEQILFEIVYVRL